MVEGMVSRDIYLPQGVWKDNNNGNYHTGPTWLYSYPANLSVLPYFTRTGTTSGSVNISSKMSTTVIVLFVLFLLSKL